MIKKLLIIHSTGGYGHISAANALESAFLLQYPDIEVKNIDVVSFALKFYRDLFVKGYNYISSKHPGFWGWLYHRYNDISKHELLRELSRLAIESRLTPFIKKFRPDFIVSTHPLPSHVIALSKD